MKKLMTAMLALSFLGATAMIAQVPAPAAKSDTAKKPAKKAAKKTATEEKKADTAKKPAKKAAKKADTTEKK
jgi:hypothetical protein